MQCASKKSIKNMLIDCLVADDFLDEECLENKIIEILDSLDSAVKLKQLEIQREIELAKLQMKEQERQHKLEIEEQKRKEKLQLEKEKLDLEKISVTVNLTKVN